MIQVYHALVMDAMYKETAGIWPEEYAKVAEVDTDQLEVAFELTNTIHRPWWTNPGVRAVKPTRSTSVGDVLVTPDGKAHRCMPSGWKTLG